LQKAASKSKRSLASRFPAFDRSPLPEVWWYVDDETSTTDAEDSRRRYRECGFMEPELRMRKRVDAFVDALYAQPERVIAVFGHSDFFNEVFERHLGIENYAGSRTLRCTAWSCRRQGRRRPHRPNVSPPPRPAAPSRGRALCHCAGGRRRAAGDRGVGWRFN
jgi:hypothetical protein